MKEIFYSEETVKVRAENREKALLISVNTCEENPEVSLNELSELAQTAGADVCGMMLQNLQAPVASTYVGSGKLEEITEFCRANDIDVIIADNELTPVQAKNIEDITDVRVIDRTMLILDIFAGRARSAEGKIQVELAQLKYSLPRLTGKGTSLSRLGGGIGTRGPGETKLETDKRHIRRRISYLKENLSKIENRRKNMHIRRQKNGVTAVAIVGYTNVGKSTLMNRLTDAGVLAEDKLFATLDPTARRLLLPDGREVMLVDTVGLVRRLPHQLIDAFKSTLEEALWADVILNVCDASSEECSEQVRVTNDLLSSLGCDGKPVLNVLNKCDLSAECFEFELIGNSVCTSAKTGEGIDALLNKLSGILPQNMKRVKLFVPYSMGSVMNELRECGSVHSQKYQEDGILLDTTADISYLEKIKDYIL